MFSPLKRIALIVSAIAIFMAGCSPTPQKTVEVTAVPTAQKALEIATASAGGVWSPLGTALASLISEYVPGTPAVARETGGAIDNLKLIASGEVPMAFSYDYHVVWMNEGKLEGVVEGKKPARIILGLYEQPLHVITLAGTGITKLADLKGKNVSTGAAGSGAEEQAVYVLKALGLDPDKDLKRQKLSLNDSAAALKAKTIDAFFWSGAVPSEATPTPALAELSADTTAKMVLLPVSGKVAEDTMKANPGVFHSMVIKKGEYGSQTADVETLGVTAVLITMDTFPADQVTVILNAVFAHKDDKLVPVWKGAANLTPAQSLSVLAPETLPYLHPAAAKVLQTP